MNDERTRRLYALKRAAEEIATPRTPAGQVAREELAKSTGLSPEGVDYALRFCLEHDVPRGTLSSLTRKAERTSRAHVLLSSNVFTATFRAIALALCQSEKVTVRASRREPIMAELLHELSGGVFDLADELHPESGDHLWAYGSDSTLEKVAATLPSGIHFHGHGNGMGVAIFREAAALRAAEISEATRALARDVCAFDQRGCLSPRLLFVQGSRSFAEDVCDALVAALDQMEKEMPRGSLSDEEQADARWHEDTLRFVGSCAPAGRGMVFLDPVTDRVMIPPVGRYLNVTVTTDVLPLVRDLGDRVTTVGFFEPGHLPGLLGEEIGDRRYVDVGQMQRPVFDGPVDRRKGWDAQIT